MEILFEERFIKNFKKLCNIDLIIENKLYSKNIKKNIMNKLNDDSEETENKIAIFGLFRNTYPFNTVGDILKISSIDQLNDLYNKWYKKILSEIVKTSFFAGKDEIARKYLNTYIENIKTLGNNAKPFNIKKIEETLIDVVNNNRWIEDFNDTPNLKKNSIYKPDKKDVLYEDENIIILEGNTSSKCILYGEGESWCISKKDVNLFTTYRNNSQATIYFVLQKNEKYPEHKIVILNYGNDNYSIADQSNDNKRTGSDQYSKTWREVEIELPNLKGKEKYFQYVPLTEEEKKYHELVSKVYDGDNFLEYINEITNNLYFKNNPISLFDFFKDYLVSALRGYLEIDTFDSLWENKFDKEVDKMILYYLSTGVGIGEYQLSLIEKENKYLKLYLKNRRKSIESGNSIFYYELNHFKDLKLTDNQISNLMHTTNSYDYNKLLEKRGDDIINYINNIPNSNTKKLVGLKYYIDKFIRIIVDNNKFLLKLNSEGLKNLMDYIQSEILFKDFIFKIFNIYFKYKEHDGLFFKYFINLIHSMITLGYFNNKEMNNIKNSLNIYLNKYNIEKDEELEKQIKYILNKIN